MRFSIRLFAVALLGLTAFGASATQQQIKCSTSSNCTTSGPANTGTGDPFYAAFGKTNANFTDLYSQVSALAPIPSGLTLSALTQAYTAVTAPPYAWTSDFGFVTWNGSAWVTGQTVSLGQGGIPFIMPPAGTMGNNCAFTLGTALDTTYPNAYVYFFGSEIASGSYSGWYYTVMSSTTAGTCYNNPYRFGNPTVPASPTAFSTTGPGAFSPTLSTFIPGPTVNVPGNALGNNGKLTFSLNYGSNATSNTKTFQTGYAGSNFGNNFTLASTSVVSANTMHEFFNNGTTNNQIALVPTGSGFNHFSVDTTRANVTQASVALSTATDWAIIQSFNVTATGSKITDGNLTAQSLVPASASIVPPLAAAMGYTTNAFFQTLSASSIDFTNTAGDAPLYPGRPNCGTSPCFPSSQAATVTDAYGNSELELIFPGSTASQPAVSTVTANKGYGTLPTLTASIGFACFAALRDSSNDQDHWPAFFLEPLEKDLGTAVLSGSPSGYQSWVEIDADEELGYINTAWPQYGSTHSALYWHGPFGGTLTLTAAPSTGATSGTLSSAFGGVSDSGYPITTSTGQSLTATLTNSSTAITFSTAITGSPTATLTLSPVSDTYNNLQAANIGAYIDRTVEHVWGVAYNPTAKTLTYDLDGIVQWSTSTASYDAAINSWHYYLIIATQNQGGNHAYNRYLRYISCWHP